MVTVRKIKQPDFQTLTADLSLISVKGRTGIFTVKSDQVINNGELKF